MDYNIQIAVIVDLFLFTSLTLGIYLSFNRTVIANKSVIQITEIGGMDTYTAQESGVQCITDRMPCCWKHQFRAGEWLFPNGSNVPAQGSATVFYRNRGDDGTVNLNLLNSDFPLPLLTGLFCCVMPDANDVIQTVCADISKLLCKLCSIFH